MELEKPLGCKSLRYLVVGTGRSGTVYLAKLLSSVGIPCSHEGIFDHQGLGMAQARINNVEPIRVSLISKLASVADEKEGIGWFHGNRMLEADSSYLAVPFIDHPQFKKTKIIHVVREPLKVISSFINNFDYFTDESFIHRDHSLYLGFITKYLPKLLQYKDPIDRAVYYYLQWNQLVEIKRPDRFIYRLGSPVERLFAFLEVKPKNFYNRVANSKFGKEPKQLDFDSIPNLELRRQLRLFHKRYFHVKI